MDGIADPEMHARIASDPNYMRIDPVSSREQYRWMERFIPMVEDAELREGLTQAIDGKGAFRRFKDVLMSYGPERERWFAFRSERLRVFMEAWLDAHALVPVARPVWPAEPRRPAPPSRIPSRRTSSPGRRGRSAETLRKQLAELAETLGARDLEKVTAFAEFVKARRAARSYAHRHDGGGEATGDRESRELTKDDESKKPDSERRRRAHTLLPQTHGLVALNRCALLPLAAALGLSLWFRVAPARAEPLVLDRVAVRFTAPETGGVRSPRFIFQRVLAFEARLEALADPDRVPGDPRPYRDRHIRAALERHITETLLASSHIDPEPTDAELTRQTNAARLMLLERIGGVQALEQAAHAEGIESREILGILRRRARASLYLDRMVAPMLSPSDAELRNIHRTVQTPFKNRPFDQIEAALRRWYVSRRLAASLASYYQNARSRVDVTIIGPEQ